MIIFSTPDISKGLAITSSNILIGETPTITDEGADQVASDISSPDHSLNYTSGPSASDFTVNYGAKANISYVAVSGHTVATVGAGTIELYDETNLIQSVTLNRNNNVMFTFDPYSFTELIIKFIPSSPTIQVTVSYIAAGEVIMLPKGEQAGYARNWLVRHTSQRTTSNFEVAPISSTQRKRALNGVLSMPNELAAFIEGQWQQFVDFSYEQPFFIKESQDKINSTYICYDPKHSSVAHPQTRELDAMKLSFTCYNGI